MNKKILALAILAIALLAGAIAYFRLSTSQDQTDGRVTSYGNVEIREVSLGFRVPGRVTEIHFEEGETVQRGDTLARLDTEPLESRLAGAKARTSAMAAELERLRNGFRPEEIAQAEAQLAERRVMLKHAELDLRRQRSIDAAGAGTQQDLDRLSARAEEAKAQVGIAEARVKLLKAGYRSEEIAVAESRLLEAKAEVSSLELQVRDGNLTAPANGTVLVRAVEPGAMVNVGQTCLTLTIDERTWVRAYIPEPQLGRIRPGMTALVYTDSRPDKPYRGHIGFIASQAEFTPKNVETEELRTALIYRFRVILDEPDEGLRQAMPVTVVLEP